MLLETTTSVEVKGDTSRCSARRLLIVKTAQYRRLQPFDGFAYVSSFLFNHNLFIMENKQKN